MNVIQWIDVRKFHDQSISYIGQIQIQVYNLELKHEHQLKFSIWDWSMIISWTRLYEIDFLYFQAA